MLGGRSSWVRFSRHFRYSQHRRFCNNNKNSTSLTKQPHGSNGSRSSSKNDDRGNSIRDVEAYRDLDKLDFTKAAKILFSDTPRKKKFGLPALLGQYRIVITPCNVAMEAVAHYQVFPKWILGSTPEEFLFVIGLVVILLGANSVNMLDFHLVQLFFALMPSLAVYLVAQYARHEMRKMEAELEEKKKAEEEKKAKETEKLAEEEKAQGSDPELLKVKERLEALEETIKEIVVEAKKQSSQERSARGDQNQDRADPKSSSDDSHAAVVKQHTPLPGLGQQHKHQDSENRGSHQVDKK